MASGGKRPGSGRPRKSLAENLLDGNPGRRPLKVVQLNKAQRMRGVPEPPEYLSMTGREIFSRTVDWLADTGCLDQILPAHIEEYAQCKARWLECEAFIARFGLLAKHPKTGLPCPSPYIDISVQYLKAADTAWGRIHEIVKSNCTEEFKPTPHADAMSRLLSMKG
jgi:phage terminase small subunit